MAGHAADETIGDRIRLLVKDQWSSQREAAEALQVNPALLSRWLTDTERPPGEETIQRIAEATGSTPWWIRYGVGGRYRETEAADGLAAVIELAQEHSTVEALLRQIPLEDALGAAYRAAVSEGWGVEAVTRLTTLAKQVLPPDAILGLLSETD